MVSEDGGCPKRRGRWREWVRGQEEGQEFKRIEKGEISRGRERDRKDKWKIIRKREAEKNEKR